MLKKLKNRIYGYLPVSRKYYIDTFSSMLKIIDAQKEIQVFLRNDVFQLAKVVNSTENKPEIQNEGIKKDDNMFG